MPQMFNESSPLRGRLSEKSKSTAATLEKPAAILEEYRACS